MFPINLPAILILFSTFPVLFLQQIFENSHLTCKFFNTDFRKEDQKLEIVNTLWTITGTGRNAAIKVFFSPCGDPIPPTMGCDPSAAACIINTRNPRKSILNAGRFFNYTVDGDSKNVLQSIDGQRCSQDENFTVIVQFECDPYTKSTPTFKYKDDCELRIGMMKPTCTPTCTTRVDENLIDLRQLESLGSITVHEPNKERSFVLSICKAAKQCGTDEVSACETTGGTIVHTASTNWQQITYEPSKNALVIKSHFGNNKRIRKNTEIHLKCNWTTQGIANLKYIVPVTQGRNYKFEAESSLACIKLPMNCVIKPSFINYLVYNLTSLNKKNGGWKVGNVTSGNMYINICGPLVMSEPNRVCSDQYSQSCYINRARQYVNLGSVPFEFRVTSENTVTGNFVDGSICSTNQNLTYSTEIEFTCSRRESGPILESVNECTYKIKWETPTACSKHFATSDADDCIISDITGIVNLSSIHKTTDRIYNLARSSYLRYNLCGPLNQPCNKNENAGICYVKNGREHVVGLSSKMLTRDNALLSLMLVGDECDSRTTAMTKIYFRCNYLMPLDGYVRVNMVKDSCLFEINIDTPLACAKPSFSECKVYNDNSVFDLTPLLRNDSNYVLRDGTSNAVFMINVCRSVINSGEASLCPPGTGVCKNNLTEPHVQYRFLSMGNVNSRSTPTVENGDVVIRYNAGSYCAEADTLHHSTVIRFRCSEREESPRLLKKESCSHEFVWHTRSACAKEVLSVKTRSTNNICKYIHPHTGKLVDFADIHKMLKIETGNGDVYIFSLCENNYTHCSSNGTECETLESTVQLLSNKTDPYLEYILKNECFTDQQANKIHIHLKCEPFLGNEHFNITGISNCTFHINLLTNLICSSKESRVSIPINTGLQMLNESTKEYNNFESEQIADDQEATSVMVPNETSTIKKKITSNETNKHSSLGPLKSPRNNCIIRNSRTNSQLDLKYIKPITISSPTGVNYTVTLSEPSSICGGHICKNDLQIESNECPNAIQFNHTYSVIKLLYKSSYQVCANGRYRSEIWLKCNSTVELPSILREETCSVVIIYPLKEACSLLRSAEGFSSTNTTEIAIGSSIGLLVIAMSAIGGFLVIRKHPPKICSRSCYQTIPEDKESVRVYLKDTKL